MNCPISCGKCCALWHNVCDILKDNLDRPKTDPCPHLGKSGCSLPVEDRPLDCTFYLCAPGAVQRLLTFKEEGDQVILREALADFGHRMWSQWALYMLDNMTEENVARWRRWATSNFLELTPEETISDYSWADKMLALVKMFLDSAKEGTES